MCGRKESIVNQLTEDYYDNKLSIPDCPRAFNIVYNCQLLLKRVRLIYFMRSPHQFSQDEVIDF